VGLEGGAVHGKVLENGKGVRGNKNVGKMWCVNGIKLVLGPGVSKSGLRCQKLLQQVQKNLRSSRFGVTQFGLRMPAPFEKIAAWLGTFKA